MNIYKNISELVGKTPLMELTNYCNEKSLDARIAAKLECFNPAGSAKDRVAKQMLDDAEAQGILKKGSVIVEPTSGNTGIGLAAMGISRGYKVILTMPDTMSVERIALLKAYGAEVVLTKGSEGMTGAIKKAQEIAKENGNSFLPDQFANPSNSKAHALTTGVEIWEDTEGTVDLFVAGIGTGGTITGTGEYLKSKNPNIKIVGVEPYSSPLLSKGEAGPHGLQGIGANFVPKVLNTDIYDEIITVKEEEAYRGGREMAHTEGLLVGITSGAVLHAATVLAEREENKGKLIVALMPDTGERYLSTDMFKGV
ncbi:MAG: cysteine synthase A [Clostridia bacterium]|nr:cysteine synthase A [Clostridia bacterium]